MQTPAAFPLPLSQLDWLEFHASSVNQGWAVRFELTVFFASPAGEILGLSNSSDPRVSDEIVVVRDDASTDRRLRTIRLRLSALSNVGIIGLAVGTDPSFNLGRLEQECRLTLEWGVVANPNGTGKHFSQPVPISKSESWQQMAIVLMRPRNPQNALDWRVRLGVADTKNPPGMGDPMNILCQEEVQVAVPMMQANTFAGCWDLQDLIRQRTQKIMPPMITDKIAMLVTPAGSKTPSALAPARPGGLGGDARPRRDSPSRLQIPGAPAPAVLEAKIPGVQSSRQPQTLPPTRAPQSPQVLQPPQVTPDGTTTTTYVLPMDCIGQDIHSLHHRQTVTEENLREMWAFMAGLKMQSGTHEQALGLLSQLSDKVEQFERTIFEIHTGFCATVRKFKEIADAFGEPAESAESAAPGKPGHSRAPKSGEGVASDPCLEGAVRELLRAQIGELHKDMHHESLLLRHNDVRDYGPSDFHAVVDAVIHPPSADIGDKANYRTPLLPSGQEYLPASLQYTRR